MFTDMRTDDMALDALRRDVSDIFSAALSAVEAGSAVRRALAFATVPPGARLHLLALGKAAPAMAAAAVAHLREQGQELSGGLVVAHNASPAPHPRVSVLVGDHPVPGLRSAAAASSIGDFARQVAPVDVVWVMLSGGTSSLIGAPNATMSIAELSDLNEVLLASGIDIAAMNIVRKRVSRWGGGRLALALEPAQVRVFGISDVPGNDLAALGSGPLVPDETTTDDVRALLRMKGLWMRVPAVVRELLVRNDETTETPKADNPAFRHVTTQIIASNATAVNAALQRATALGYRSSLANAPLSGPAAAAGKELARELLDAASSGAPVCLVSGGETVVDLTNRPHNAMGGRSQELALAAAAELARGGALQRLALLAAGTDGRDGPTDAAGAVVTPATWRAITAAGRNPERDLLVHDAYRALDAAGALMRTGASGTNVMDIAIGVAR